MLTADKVKDIFYDCLFRDNESHEKFVIGQGLRAKFAFHPERLQSHIDEIEEMLTELPEEFGEDNGGYTFMKLPFDKEGRQWGEQMNAEQLVALGIAIGKCKYPFPTLMWPMLPGGVPYVMINEARKEIVIEEI